MSWACNITPWWLLIKMCNEQAAMECCAFVNEIHVSEFRDDYNY